MKLPTVKHDAPQNFGSELAIELSTLSFIGNCTGIPADGSSCSPIVSEIEWGIYVGGFLRWTVHLLWVVRFDVWVFFRFVFTEEF